MASGGSVQSGRSPMTAAAAAPEPNGPATSNRSESGGAIARAAPPARARPLVLEQPLEFVKPMLGRDRRRDPLAHLLPTDRRGGGGNDHPGRTAAGGERQGKIGHECTAVNEKTLCHQ